MKAKAKGKAGSIVATSAGAGLGSATLMGASIFISQKKAQSNSATRQRVFVLARTQPAWTKFRPKCISPRTSNQINLRN